MAGFSYINTDTSVTISVDHVSGYNWYHVVLRENDGYYNTSIVDEFYNRTSDFSLTFTGLTPGYPYMINVGYGTVNGGSVVAWMGGEPFTTDDEELPPVYDTAAVTISMHSGIRFVSISYQNENGYEDWATVYGSEVIYIKQGTSATVETIMFNSGYSHPVYCHGDTSWQMTSTSGSYIDNSLYVGYVPQKSFSFNFSSTPPGEGGSGLVWISGNWYKPYIYSNGLWQAATSTIYTNGDWYTCDD